MKTLEGAARDFMAADANVLRVRRMISRLRCEIADEHESAPCFFRWPGRKELFCLPCWQRYRLHKMIRGLSRRRYSALRTLRAAWRREK